MKVFITKTHLPARGYSLMAAKRLTEEDIENIFNDSSSDDDSVSDCSETYSEVLEVESSEEIKKKQMKMTGAQSTQLQLRMVPSGVC